MNTQPRTQKELCALYHVSFNTWKRWCIAYGLDTITSRRSNRLGYILQPDEVQIIIKTLGEPCS